MSATIDFPNAVLNWTAYSLPGVTVSYYYVCLKRDPASAECDSLTRVDPSQTSYILTGLTEPGVYYLSVYAETDSGNSSASGDLVVTVTGPPAAVSGFSANAISSRQISYSFSPYQLSSGTVYNYLICLKLTVNQTGCNVLKEIPTTETSYIVGSLSANTVYYSTIYANTSLGLSVESETVAAKTLEGG